VRYWLTNELVFLLGVLRLCQFCWKSIKKCDRERAHRRSHRLTDAHRFYNLSHAICYSYGTDTKCMIMALQHVVVCSVGWNVSLLSQLPVLCTARRSDALADDLLVSVSLYLYLALRAYTVYCLLVVDAAGSARLGERERELHTWYWLAYRSTADRLTFTCVQVLVI